MTLLLPAYPTLFKLGNAKPPFGACPGGGFIIFAAMETEDIYLSVHLPQHNRTVVLEGDGFSLWVYLLNEEQEGVEFSGLVCSLGKISTDMEEVQRFAKEGNQPPLHQDYAAELAVQEGLDQEGIRVEELDDNLIVIYLDDEPFVKIDPENKLVYSKALKEAGPYGHPFESMPTSDNEA